MTSPTLTEHFSVNTPLTPKRRTRVVENDEYAAFLRRVIRAYSRRVAAGDIEAITTMAALGITSTRPSATPSPACAATATPGPTSPCGSASPAKAPSNAGAVKPDDRIAAWPH
jgi:hypothetical protein